MAQPLQLTKSQFLELVDCTFDEKVYPAILKSRGLAMRMPPCHTMEECYTGRSVDFRQAS